MSTGSEFPCYLIKRLIEMARGYHHDTRWSFTGLTTTDLLQIEKEIASSPQAEPHERIRDVVNRVLRNPRRSKKATVAAGLSLGQKYPDER